MNELIINYYLNSDYYNADKQPLGIEKKIGFQENLIPGHSEDSHKITISNIFEGHSAHRWLIKQIIHDSNNETSIFIEPRVNNEEFLSQTKKSNKHVISRLQLGTLIEVEFGYIPVIKKINGDIRSNKRYPDTIHKGEIHKRRLCVVVKANGNRVQVVPVTSQNSSVRDLSTFELSFNSLKDLVGYNAHNITSYGLCNMIKTVSISRILPPLARNNRTRASYRDNRYSKKLNGSDCKKFKESLSHSVGFPYYSSLKEKVGDYFNELEDLKRENLAIKLEVEQLKNEKCEYEVMEKRYNTLLEIMTDWRMGASEDSEEQAKKHIENEITEFDIILND